MRKMLVLTVALLAVSARADDVSDQINEALAAYKAGKFAQAASDLEFAVQAIRTKQAEQLKVVFPNAPSGWDADEAEVAAAGMAMMGGGIGASRQYRKKVKEDAPETPSVHISIAGESPLLQAALMMLSNPMMAGAQGKPIKLGSTKGFLKLEKGQPAEISAVVANKLLVTVKGDSGATEAEVTALAKAIDFAKLEKLVAP